MAKVTRIKAQDDGKKKAPKPKTAVSAEEPVRKVSVKAKGAPNKRVAKSRLEREAERELEIREKDRAEKRAVKEAYRAKKAEIKAQLKTAKKSEKKATKRKVKQELKELRKDYLEEHPGYFRGAVRELRQVRWPNRKQTWKLTLAVIIYIIIVAVFLMALDAILKLVFNKLIGGNM